MIHVDSTDVRLVGDTKTLLAECSVAVGALIYSQSKAAKETFEKTTEWIITHITEAILYAHSQQEKEKTGGDNV